MVKPQEVEPVGAVPEIHNPGLVRMQTQLEYLVVATSTVCCASSLITTSELDRTKALDSWYQRNLPMLESPRPAMLSGPIAWVA